MPKEPHIEARIRYLTTDEGGRKSAVSSGYRGQFHYENDPAAWDAPQLFVGTTTAQPGATVTARLTFMSPDAHVDRIEEGMKFNIQEGIRVVGKGVVTKVLPAFTRPGNGCSQS